MVDCLHRAVERHRRTAGIGGDERAIAVGNAPVHTAVGVVVKIVHRHGGQLGAGDVGGDRADQAIPAPARFEQVRCRPIGRARRFAHMLEENVERGAEFPLLIERKAERERVAHPGRWGLVDDAALALGDRHPGVTVGGMQPAAAEIERAAVRTAHRPGAAAETVARLDQQAFYVGVVQSAGRADAGARRRRRSQPRSRLGPWRLMRRS